MNIKLFKKSLGKIFYFIVLCFVSPVIIMQAFKNNENVLFFPVLLFGIFLSSIAVYIGFIGINLMVKSMIGKIKKD
tara:strand:- start:1042 stop:1269 length:228 start_codon:yes stop_codon:yes gene_type:complete